MNTIRYTGGCACGAVRYQAAGPAQLSFHCQCRQCQRASGAGHASLFVVPAGAASLSGELRFFDQIADDGSTVSRGFCPACGSPVVGKTTGHPDILLFTAASLDDPTLFTPQKVVWSASGQPWDYTDPALPVS
jgi:hypothetical protein